MANSKQRIKSIVCWDDKKEHNGEGNASGQDDNQSDQCNTYEPPNFSQSGPLVASIGAELEVDKAREETAWQALLEGINESGDSADHSLTQSADNVGQREETVNERLFEQFESAIQKSARIWDISRSGQLTDNEWCQQAGDAALMLMDILGQMGCDGNDDENDKLDDSDQESASVENVGDWFWKQSYFQDGAHTSFSKRQIAWYALSRHAFWLWYGKKFKYKW